MVTKFANRRHADRTAELWLERLKESNTSKKLNLVYLANGNAAAQEKEKNVPGELTLLRGRPAIQSKKEGRLPPCL